jgi:hypothetical protein
MNKFCVCLTILLLLNQSIYSQENTTKANPTEDNPFLESDLAKNIVSSMGLDIKDELTKKEFETLFYRILSRDQPSGNNAQFIDGISKKLSKDMPEVILRGEIVNYMSKDSIIRAVEETVKEQYGPEYVSGIREQIQKTLFEEENNANSDDSTTQGEQKQEAISDSHSEL